MRHYNALHAFKDSDPRGRLRELIRELSFAKGQFKLASGRTSNYFFDLKPTMLHPEGINLLADAILEEIKGLEADYIGGLAMGAVPVVVAVVMRSQSTDRPLKGFWVRTEMKDHGIVKAVDGDLADRAKVVIVDDVTTTGGSVMKAIEAAKKKHCDIKAVITVVDRLEGAKENLSEQGIELISLFTTEDFLG
jgi:orotate phosphoribosyltransferase